MDLYAVLESRNSCYWQSGKLKEFKQELSKEISEEKEEVESQTVSVSEELKGGRGVALC